MYLPGMPKKDGTYWLCIAGEKVEDSQICFFSADIPAWFDIGTKNMYLPQSGDKYWDLPLVAPKDYAMGGSYSCYMRDVDQKLEEIRDYD